MRPIDADALHAKIYEDSERSYGAEANIAQILLRIETAPTIEAEPVRHGRWITDNTMPVYTCSKCHYSVPKNIFVIGCDFNYCPYCGALMDGGDDNG